MDLSKKYFLIAKAMELHKNREYREAIDIYRKITEAYPLDKDAWNNMGCALDDNGDSKKAKRSL